MSDEESNEYQLREDGLKINDHLRAESSGNLWKMWKLHDHKNMFFLSKYLWVEGNNWDWDEEIHYLDMIWNRVAGRF